MAKGWTYGYSGMNDRYEMIPAEVFLDEIEADEFMKKVINARQAKLDKIRELEEQAMALKLELRRAALS